MPILSFKIGQRWISETQPELGLGIVVDAEHGRVKIHFPASGESLMYATHSAPLRRVAFEEGDTVERQGGGSFVVGTVRKQDGLIIYVAQDGGEELHESQLADTMSFQKPEAQLIAGHADHRRVCNLRREALRHRYECRMRESRGLIGGRISLMPHQLFIAREVTGRQAPRVLLSDEVGLGKTIEACLVLHRLQLNGRAERIIVIVPEPLVHQWFVELLRRFHVMFKLFDEERCVSMEEHQPDDNPFLDDQLILCSAGWLAEKEKRAAQAAEAGWDLVVVDEAHHLEWTPEKASPAYLAVEAIAQSSPGLLLLTATPEQLGVEGHFARLRLLDPDRYEDLDRFLEESKGFREISQLAERVLSEKKVTAADSKKVLKLIGESELPEDKEEIARALLDLHGTGRVMFRNRRDVLTGFPEREVNLIPLDGDDAHTAKLGWLVELLRANASTKFLLICATREMVEKLEDDLMDRISVDTALFHEGLTLIQRDRNAAWFSEDDGARVLLCSEIGSEGRNFQFAHHLILFDLPADPGLLEQRIGRLDRIGQTETIHIHVPFAAGSDGELWARWYHEGLDAFEHTLHGSAAIYREFAGEVAKLASREEAAWREAWPELLERTKASKERIAQELKEGRDHLLEMSSFDRPEGERIAGDIASLDEERMLSAFMLRIFDHFGVSVEDLGSSLYLLKPERLFSTEAFPDIPQEGLSITFKREIALAREEIVFVTWDHPMVLNAIDMLLASDRGNANFVEFRNSGEQSLIVDVVFVLEPVAPAKLHADRFLAPSPLRSIVDHHLKDRAGDIPLKALRRAPGGDHAWLRERSAGLRDMLPKMIKAAEKFTQTAAEEVRSRALERMHTSLDAEIERLERLKELNHPVRDSEIEMAKAEREELVRVLSEARLRLDSVRLVHASK